MKLPANIAERYVSAVESEAGRDTHYAELAAAQLAHAQAKQALIDATYRLKIAQDRVDDRQKATP